MLYYIIYIYNYNIYAINTIYNMQILERERQKGEGVGGREKQKREEGRKPQKGKARGRQ